TRLGHRLGQGRQQVADAGADAGNFPVHGRSPGREGLHPGGELLLLLYRRQGPGCKPTRRPVAADAGQRGDLGHGNGTRKDAELSKTWTGAATSPLSTIAAASTDPRQKHQSAVRDRFGARRKVPMFGPSVWLTTRGAAAATLALLPTVASSQQVEFRHVFDNSLLDVSPKPGEQFTDAVREFQRTGQNPYNGKLDAIEEGKKLYVEYCQSCHMPDGSGGMGPSLIGDKHVYDRITTDLGLFDV